MGGSGTEMFTFMFILQCMCSVVAAAVAVAVTGGGSLGEGVKMFLGDTPLGMGM
jgi:hypothetical protein